MYSLFGHQLLAVDEGGRGGRSLHRAATDAELRYRGEATAAATPMSHRVRVEEVVHQVKAHERGHEG